MIQKLRKEIEELKEKMEKENFEPMKKLLKAQIEYKEGVIKTFELLE